MNEYQVIIHVDSDDPLNCAMVRAGFAPMPEPVFEHQLYQPLTQKRYYYRMDKSNNAPSQQRHIHVYRDNRGKRQLFAMNVDGSSHDGSQYIIPKDLFAPLQKLGLTIPSGGVLEFENKRIA